MAERDGEAVVVAAAVEVVEAKVRWGLRVINGGGGGGGSSTCVQVHVHVCVRAYVRGTWWTCHVMLDAALSPDMDKPGLQQGVGFCLDFLFMWQNTQSDKIRITKFLMVFEFYAKRFTIIYQNFV